MTMTSLAQHTANPVQQTGNISITGNMGVPGAGGGFIYPNQIPNQIGNIGSGIYQAPNAFGYGIGTGGVMMTPIQYSRPIEMDALSQFNIELLKDRPTNEVEIPDAIFPSNLIGGALRFHLLVWRHGNSDINEQFWNIIDLGSPFSNTVEFRSRKFRRNFQNWWIKYTNIFFGGIPPVNDFLPKLKPGRISGTFVEQPNSLDTIAYNQPFSILNAHNMIKGLMEALPSWTWIAANCKKSVFRQSGGWLFVNGMEAAKFILFMPQK